MSTEIRIFIIILGILFFILVLELIKKKKIREELSLIWLFVSIVIILCAFADYIIDPISKYLKVSYPPMLILIIIIFVLLLVLFLFSLVISDLKTKNKELTQKIALIEFELKIKNKDNRLT